MGLSSARSLGLFSWSWSFHPEASWGANARRHPLLKALWTLRAKQSFISILKTGSGEVNTKGGQFLTLLSLWSLVDFETKYVPVSVPFSCKVGLVVRITWFCSVREGGPRKQPCAPPLGLTLHRDTLWALTTWICERVWDAPLDPDKYLEMLYMELKYWGCGGKEIGGFIF